jgi:hypothetical protein
MIQKVHRAIQAAGTICQHQRTDRVCLCETGKPLRTAEMTLEDNYGMISGIINNGRRGEELEKVQAKVRRTSPEKKPSIRERLKDAKRNVHRLDAPGQARLSKEAPRGGQLMSRSKKWRLEWAFFLGENGRCQCSKLCKVYVHRCKQNFRAVVSCPHYLSLRSPKCGNQFLKQAKETTCIGFAV